MATEADNDTKKTSDSNDSPLSMGKSISQNAIRLGVFALLCTLFIAGTQLLTNDSILEQQRKAQLKALLEIVPENKHDNDMLSSFILTTDKKLGLRDEKKIFVAMQNGLPKALIYPAIARDGYSGDIVYIVGVSTKDDTVQGVRVLSHKETPGLGDAIDLRKSDWILDFNGKSLQQPGEDKWTVKKEGGVFDAFTGATITPRALTKSVANTLRFHRDNKKELLNTFEANPSL